MKERKKERKKEKFVVRTLQFMSRAGRNYKMIINKFSRQSGQLISSRPDTFDIKIYEDYRRVKW